jgi:hypothetical protein
MAAKYPAELPTFPTYADNAANLTAANMNQICDELLAGLTELGTDPAGALATLKARMLVTIATNGLPVWGTPGALTIASGSITPITPTVIVDTESAAATDDLDTIVAGVDGQLLRMRIAADARNVRVRHGAGNIVCPGATNITMDLTSDIVLGYYDATLSKWIITGSTSADYVAAQIAAHSRYGGFYAYNKAILINILVADTYQAVRLVTAGDIVTGLVNGFTFYAGRSVDANITSEGNPSASILLITCSANHGLTTGDLVVLGNMNNASHNKPTRATVTGLTTFTCDDISYIGGAGASAGTVEQPAYLMASSGSAGVYQANIKIDGTASNLSKAWKFEANVDIAPKDNVVTERTSTATLATMSAFGLITIADGDRVWISAKNGTDTSDYTIQHLNLNLIKV